MDKCTICGSDKMKVKKRSRPIRRKANDWSKMHPKYKGFYQTVWYKCSHCGHTDFKEERYFKGSKELSKR